MMMNLRRSQMMVTDKDYIQFADPVVAQICADNWGDGKGITYKQAAKVTDIGRVFNRNTEITSFEELQYFTGVTNLVGGSSSVGGAFWKCSALTSIKFPPSLTSFGQRAFMNCTLLNIAELPIETTVINDVSFYGINTAPQDIILPNLTTLGISAFTEVGGIKRVLDLGSITALAGGGAISSNSSPFRSCPDIELFIIPSTVTTMGKGAISFLPSLTTLISKASTPPTYTDNSLYQLTALEVIYVPDASVSAYQSATGWATYADKIKPLSEYTE